MAYLRSSQQHLEKKDIEFGMLRQVGSGKVRVVDLEPRKLGDGSMDPDYLALADHTAVRGKLRRHRLEKVQSDHH